MARVGAAAGGLDLYTRSLIWRLRLSAAAYLLLVLAAQAQSMSMLRTLGWAIPLIGLITGGLMTIGVVRFAKVPESSCAGAPAKFAAAMMALALLIDVYALTALLDAAESPERARGVAVWGMALSLSAFVALLVSFHRAASELGEHGLASMCTVAGLIVASCAAVAIGARMWLGELNRLELETVVLGGGLVIICLVAAVVVYLLLLRKLRDRLAAEVLRLDP